jgi:tetratricopeptide (TPR) repeat protein
LHPKIQSMAKKSDKTEDKIVAVEQALSRTEQFFEKNKKIITIVLGAIIVIVGAYIGYKKLYIGPKEIEAQKQMFMAERYFEQDSLKKAINGDGNYLGFADIADQYGMTKSGNLAHYYLGMCYLKTGQFQQAIDNLKDFSSDDLIVGAMAKGAIGDAYCELGDMDKAAEYYMKAADYNENDYSTPLFLMKAGWVYEDQKKYDEALKAYERVQKEHVRSYEFREIEKYIARAKGLAGKK